MAGGFHAARPLALGVVVGDVSWPLLAIFGVGWIISVYAPFPMVLRWTGAALFLCMGPWFIARAGGPIHGDSRLKRPRHSYVFRGLYSVFSFSGGSRS